MQNLLLTFVMTVGVFVAVFILMSLGYFVYHVAIKGTCAQSLPERTPRQRGPRRAR